MTIYESAPHNRSDLYRLFVDAVPTMVELARLAAQDEAYSYRGFLVGAAVFAHKPATNETAVLAAGNLKSQRHKTKVCAEKKALNVARAIGMVEAIGLVVAGTTDVELIKEVNNVSTATLHPCSDCQNLFVEHPIMRDHTIIIMTGLEDDIYQVTTSREMLDTYQSGRRAVESLPVHSFDDWEDRATGYHLLNATEEATKPLEQQRPKHVLARMALGTAPPIISSEDVVIDMRDIPRLNDGGFE